VWVVVVVVVGGVVLVVVVAVVAVVVAVVTVVVAVAVVTVGLVRGGVSGRQKQHSLGSVAVLAAISPNSMQCYPGITPTTPHKTNRTTVYRYLSCTLNVTRAMLEKVDSQHLQSKYQKVNNIFQ
jgi:hypothetical protein